MLLHSYYDPPDADSVHDQYDRGIDALEVELPKVAEQHDEWIEGRRCLGLDVLARSRTDKPIDGATALTEEMTPALTA